MKLVMDYVSKNHRRIYVNYESAECKFRLETTKDNKFHRIGTCKHATSYQDHELPVLNAADPMLSLVRKYRIISLVVGN